MICTKCPCYINEYNINCVQYSGFGFPEFYFLGEQYGRSECLSKEQPAHFIGDAGKKFDELLKLGGIDRAYVAVANAARCYKAENKRPTKKELDACFIYTYREVRRLKPKVVIAMGEVAMYQATGKEGLRYYLGKLLWSDKLKCKVFVTYHPAAIIYDPDKKPILEEHFKRIPKLIDEEPFVRPDYPYTVVSTTEDGYSMWKKLYGRGLGIDCETNGLDPWDKDYEFRSLQLGTADDIYILDLEAIYKFKKKLKGLIENCYFLGQDFSFDVKWLFLRLSIMPKHWQHDCCLADYLISGMGNNDLNYLTGKYNPDLYGYWEEVKELGGAHKVKDKKVLHQYGANDIGTMFPIMKKQRKKLAVNNQLSLFTDIWMPCNKVLTKMSLRGVKIDLDKLWELDKKYDKKAKKALYKALLLPGIEETQNHFKKKFNPRSPDHVRWLLINYYKLPVLKKTKKSVAHPDGRAKTSKDEMKIYTKEHKNPYCIAMENYRSIQTVRDNFLSGIVPKLKNGVAHTRYSLHGTNSGRPNSKEPNLLNFPSKDDFADVKGVMVARPGFVFLERDMSQIEVKIASVLYYDKNLIEACNVVGKDFHCTMTAKVYQRPYDEIYQGYITGDPKICELRRICKSITFGILYQMGPKELGYRLGKTKEKAAQFIIEYFAMFPDLERRIEEQKQFVIENGYVETYFKFRRYWRYHTKDDHATIREAVNTPIQGTAWNLMQLSLIEVDKLIEPMESRLVLQIYDSMIVETKESEIEEVDDIMNTVIGDCNRSYPILNEVNVTSDGKVGYNLAELEKR